MVCRMIVVFARLSLLGHDFAYFRGPGGGLEFVGLGLLDLGYGPVLWPLSV